MRGRAIRLLGCILLAALALPRLAAEEMPRAKRAHGRRETVLAGIDLPRWKLKDVEKLYGPPDHVDKTPTPPGFSEIEYVWEKPERNKLAVRTRSETGKPERLVEIDVWGEQPTGPLGKTGRGLALGDDLSTVEKTYGKRYEVLRPADPGPLALWFAWDEDFNLSLDFDGHRRVSHIQVSRNEDD